MDSFSFNDAFRFKLATQQQDTSAKIQVFIGVLLGVILRWIYSIAVDVIRNGNPWCFGTLTSILIRLAVALGITFFVFSGYWFANRSIVRRSIRRQRIGRRRLGEPLFNP